MKKHMILGIAGGTGSGKTLVAKSIGETLHEKIVVIGQDSYYMDHSDLPANDRARINYDHPDAFDHGLLLSHLQMLRDGQPVQMPVYDYATHSRAQRVVTVKSAPIIIIEGILVLAIPALRELMDVKIFVDTDADVRFIRRLTRDVRERGRTVESIVEQYLNVVRLMHLEFVEPSKRYADIIVPEGGYNRIAIDFIATKLRTLLE